MYDPVTSQFKRECMTTRHGKTDIHPIIYSEKTSRKTYQLPLLLKERNQIAYNHQQCLLRPEENENTNKLSQLAQSSIESTEITFSATSTSRWPVAK